ncbi:MAG: VCBS repeat-containing protein [Polyangiaceae bacterium]
MGSSTSTRTAVSSTGNGGFRGLNCEIQSGAESVVADIDGDGRADVVTGHEGGTLNITLSRAGRLGPLDTDIDAQMVRIPLGMQSFRPPVVGDVDSDGQLDMLSLASSSRPPA